MTIEGATGAERLTFAPKMKSELELFVCLPAAAITFLPLTSGGFAIEMTPNSSSAFPTTLSAVVV